MLFRKKKTVNCTADVLFKILAEDLADGLCTDIHFTIDGKKHRFGAWRDNGNTYKNVVFYFDEYECNSFEELKKNAMLNNIRLIESKETITVTECNGCYPESTPILQALMEK